MLVSKVFVKMGKWPICTKVLLHEGGTLLSCLFKFNPCTKSPNMVMPHGEMIDIEEFVDKLRLVFVLFKGLSTNQTQNMAQVAHLHDIFMF